jgi:uncharacterized protein (TIGR02757 family)
VTNTRTTTKLGSTLEGLYARYNHFDRIAPDPLQFVYRYSAADDMEVAALLSAALAYGRVRQIETSLTRLFDVVGPHPACFVRNFDLRKRHRLADFKHRFTTGRDISDLFELLKAVYHRFGRLEAYFLHCDDPRNETILPALDAFCAGLLAGYSGNNGSAVPKGLSYLLARPSGKSACKRMNLFFRWMVRADDVDTGLWTSVDPARLVVPVDTHMARLCRFLGLHSSRTVTIRTALQITRGFADIEPRDPLKYDFALSRIGIVEQCTGRPRPECPHCELYPYCST